MYCLLKLIKTYSQHMVRKTYMASYGEMAVHVSARQYVSVE